MLTGAWACFTWLSLGHDLHEAAICPAADLSFEQQDIIVM